MLLALDTLPQQIKAWLKPKLSFHYHLPSKDPFEETPVWPETMSTLLWSQIHTQPRSEGPCLVQSPAQGSPLLHSENPAATFPLLSNVRASWTKAHTGSPVFPAVTPLAAIKHNHNSTHTHTRTCAEAAFTLCSFPTTLKWCSRGRTTAWIPPFDTSGPKTILWPQRLTPRDFLEFVNFSTANPYLFEPLLLTEQPMDPGKRRNLTPCQPLFSLTHGHCIWTEKVISKTPLTQFTRRGSLCTP